MMALHGSRSFAGRLTLRPSVATAMLRSHRVDSFFLLHRSLSTKSKQEPHVAILGGKTPLRACNPALQMQGYKATVFEREKSLGSRSQGGLLDLHPKTGLQVVKELDLTKEYTAIAHPEAEFMHITDHLENVIYTDDPPPPVGPDHNLFDGAPETDRGQLRKMLIDSLEPGTIQWNTMVQSRKQLDDGRFELNLANGKTHPTLFEVLVGADGASSRVRQSISDAKPTYKGVTLIELKITDLDDDILDLVGAGTRFAMGDNLALVCQRNPTGVINIWAMQRVEYGGAQLPRDQPEKCKEYLRNLFCNFTPRLRRLIDKADDKLSFATYPHLTFTSDTMPKACTDDGRIVLIGDAAHTLFFGSGANSAFVDGLKLAKVLASVFQAQAESKAEPSLATAVKEFAEQMQNTAKLKADNNPFGQDLFVQDGAAQLLANIMTGFRQPEQAQEKAATGNTWKNLTGPAATA